MKKIITIPHTTTADIFRFTPTKKFTSDKLDRNKKASICILNNPKHNLGIPDTHTEIMTKAIKDCTYLDRVLTIAELRNLNEFINYLIQDNTEDVKNIDKLAGIIASYKNCCPTRFTLPAGSHIRRSAKITAEVLKALGFFKGDQTRETTLYLSEKMKDSGPGRFYEPLTLGGRPVETVVGTIDSLALIGPAATEKNVVFDFITEEDMTAYLGEIAPQGDKPGGGLQIVIAKKYDPELLNQTVTVSLMSRHVKQTTGNLDDGPRFGNCAAILGLPYPFEDVPLKSTNSKITT